MSQLGKDDLQAKAVALVKNEKNQWEDATAFITERVSFQMRNLLRQLRKNYWGVYDKPKDPVTGRDKIWMPLTESIVESIVKNIDLDTKDITLRAKHVGAIGYTAIIRNKVKQILDEMNFGEILDKMERELCINGTAVWKTLPYKDKRGNTLFNIKNVDLLNIYIDPTAESIQKAYRFTERGLFTEDEVQSNKKWMNTEDIKGTYNLSPTESRLNNFTSGTSVSGGTNLVDVWEMWGKIPKSLITGNSEDKDTEVDGHIIVSGLDSAGKEKVHVVEENKGGKKPYEEVWYRKVAGRWYGRGPAEMVMMLQLYQNTVVNIRITRSYVSQLGLFKIKRNAGITPQMMSRLATNGAIAVQNMEDVQELITKEASSASYKDEEVASTWAQKVTQAFEAVTGEQLPSSTTATSAAIQSRSANSGMEFIREGIGLFLARWMKDHILPEIGSTLKASEVVRLSGTVQELRELDEIAISSMILDEVEERNKKGQHVKPEQIESEKSRLRQKLNGMGDNRFAEIINSIDPSEYDVAVDITNEQIDKAVLASNLIQSLQLAPEFKAVIMREIFDIMGLDARQLEDVSRGLPQAQIAPPGQEQGVQEQALPKNFSLQEATTAANTAKETV